MRGFRFVIAFVVSIVVPLASLSSGAAQNWPQRTVKFIVPFGAGSGVDIAARLFADRLTQRWSKPVVIENRPGGDNVVAITVFLSGDDHTLLFSPSSAFVAHPFQNEKVPYNYADIAPIARVSNTLVVVAVPAALNISSVKELLALAQSQPDKLNWAGISGALDFVVEAFLKSTGVDIKKVPYRDGVQALNDLAENRIQLYVAALAIVRPQIEGGKVKLLAITNGERAPTHPDTPTAAEAGYPTLGFDGLVGVFGRRNMPDELRSRISADIQAIASDREVSSRLAATAQLVRPGTPEEFSASIERQRTTVAEAASRLGFKAAH